MMLQSSHLVSRSVALIQKSFALHLSVSYADMCLHAWAVIRIHTTALSQTVHMHPDHLGSDEYNLWSDEDDLWSDEDILSGADPALLAAIEEDGLPHSFVHSEAGIVQSNQCIVLATPIGYLHLQIDLYV